MSEGTRPLLGVGGRFDQNAEPIVGPQANLTAGETDNAGIPPTEHLDPSPAAQPELFEPVNVIGMAGDATDSSWLASGEITQGNRLVNHEETWGDETGRPNIHETQSHYRQV